MFLVAVITYILTTSAVTAPLAPYYAVVGTGFAMVNEMQSIDCKELGGKI
jgi:hypothetical protein